MSPDGSVGKSLMKWAATLAVAGEIVELMRIASRLLRGVVAGNGLAQAGEGRMALSTEIL